MKILCFGDSNTYGFDPRSWFGSRYPAQDRWVDLLSRKTGWETVNAGENGREIPRRKDQWEDFSRLLESHAPDLLIIMLGTNDLLQGDPAASAARAMETFLMQIPLDRSRILLIGPPPMKPGQWVPDRKLTEASAELNRAYSALSGRLGTAFADAGRWNIPLTFDGVHFTEEGHRAFAEELTAYLKQRR